MDTITGDKFSDFVLLNYENVKAIDELYSRAKTKIPEWVTREIRRITTRVITNLQQSFKQEVLDSELSWWLSSFYDYDNSIGPFMAIGLDSKWEKLTAESPEDSLYLYLYLDLTGAKEREKVDLQNAYANHMEKNAKLIIDKNILLKPWPDEREYLAVYYLHSEVNLNSIRMGEFQKLYAESVRQFTETLLPIISDFKLNKCE